MSEQSIKSLSWLGYLEGVSFLLLLGIAMPIKYQLGINEPVKYIGMVHGILFMVYVLMLMSTASRVKLPLWAMPAGVMASLLPFGPFVFDRLLKRSLAN